MQGLLHPPPNHSPTSSSKPFFTSLTRLTFTNLRGPFHPRLVLYLTDGCFLTLLLPPLLLIVLLRLFPIICLTTLASPSPLPTLPTLPPRLLALLLLTASVNTLLTPSSLNASNRTIRSGSAVSFGVTPPTSIASLCTRRIIWRMRPWKRPRRLDFKGLGGREDVGVGES